MKKVLVTGGAGFIGANLVRFLNTLPDVYVVNIDKLTYAGNLESLADLTDPERHRFLQLDICNFEDMARVIEEEQPDYVMHLAAESHVDRSIDGPAEFVNTNILGTFNLLEASRKYWESLSETQQGAFRFHHISTDEVFGDLHGTDDLFTETTPYQPSSPYSASKAGSDHLVRAWQRTYGLPCVITNCSNNYGPYQYPEKLLPLMVLNALEGKPLPVYGNGLQIRDWLYVQDHVEALWKVICEGEPGETYNIGGHNEKTNISVVKEICAILDDMVSEKPGDITNFAELIAFVEDRPGHDLRYAIDASKIERELGWTPRETFETGLRKTISWYIENQQWCELVQEQQARKRRGR